MATSMSKARKSIVFRVERDGTSFAVGELGLESGAQVVGAARDLEALLLKVVREDLVGVDLLVSDFGVLPDLFVVLSLEEKPGATHSRCVCFC